jgi:hypothetical protein
VVLTAEPEVLGWAIGLSAEHGVTLPAGRLVTADAGQADPASRPAAHSEASDHSSAPVAGPSRARYR